MQELALTSREIAIDNNLFERFLMYLDAKPKTIETYKRALKQYFDYLSRQGISHPTREDILAYREELRATVKPATIQNYITAVRLFFLWTSQEGLYKNIAEHIKGATISKEHKKDYLTINQAKSLLSGIDRATVIGKRDYAILSLMLTGGLRAIEISRADIQDIKNTGDITALFIQGKGREERAEYIKLAEPVEEALRDYLKASNRTATKESPLFISTSNRNASGRMTTRAISGIIKDRLKAAGFNSDRLTAHSLRHTAATLNLLQGGTIEETQQLLRHSNINTTMIYLHHIERAKNQSERRIASAIF